MCQPSKAERPGDAFNPVTPPDSDPPSPEVPPPDRRRFWLLCLSLVLAVLAVYGQVLNFDFVNLDDSIYVTDNSHVLQGLTWGGIGWAFTNLTAGFWHPLTWLSLMLDTSLHGRQAWGFHLTNLLLHLGSTVALFAALRHATGKPWRSALVAALFALHPLHVEAVAWVAERKEVLGAFFGFVSIYFYVRFARPAGANRKSQIANYSLSLVFFLCGLMSKTMIVTLPAVMLLLDYWPLQRVSRWGRLVAEKTPFFALGLMAGLLTIHAEQSVGAVSSTGQLPVMLRIPNALASCARYLGQTVWPANLAVFYPYSKGISAEGIAGAVVVLAGATIGALWMVRRRPYLAVGWFWYVITLLPVSGLIQVGAYSRADRFTYVPLVGVFIAVVWAVGDWAVRKGRRRAAAGFGAAAIAGLMAVTYVQAGYWKNSISLWTHTLACTPENYLARDNFGSALAKQGKLPEAIQQYNQALQLQPNFADAHSDLGNALAAQGKLEAAIQQYEQAIRLKPDFADARNNLGLALAAEGKLGQAVEQYEQALQLKPDNANVQVSYGAALAAQGKLDEAVQHYQQALQLDPDSAKACYNLGIVLAALGKLDEAIQSFERAIQLDPNYAKAHNNLGNALAKQGRLLDAVQHYEQALQINPDYIEAHFNLANALVALGKPAEAAAYLQQALDLALAQNNSALAQTIRARLQLLQASGK
jgi:tetratricopeptide (TPR) repeat protein